MLPLGTQAPDFCLPDVVSGTLKPLSDLAGNRGTVIFFICNHCPYVKHINSVLAQLANQYQKMGIAFIGISSNDVENYPEDAPEKMRETALELNYPFPYLYDESQEVARKFDAACTPDFYLFDDEKKLVYRGQMDDSRPANSIPVTGEDLEKAMISLLTGKEISQLQKPSLGCNIKWKQI
jgi:peroxiredoxin